MFGQIMDFRLCEDSLIIVTDDTPIYVEAVNSNCFRIYEERVYNSFAVTDYTKGKLNAKKVDGGVSITSSFGKVIIRDYLMMEFYDNNDNLLLKSNDSNFKRTYETNCLAQFEGHSVLEEEKMKVRLLFDIKENELFYGLGDKTGWLNKRGYEYQNYNSDIPEPHVDSFRSLYKSIPFYLSLCDELTYGVFFDNTFRTNFDFGKFNNILTIESIKGEIDFYFIYGNNLKEVVSNYTALTGRYPLPQRWSLGSHQSRWGYACKEHIDEVVNGYEENDIPLGAVHLDIDYMENYKVFTYSEKKYPKLREYIKSLNEKGVKVVTIIDPGVKVEEGYFMYDEAIKNGYAATKNGETYINAVWPGDSIYPNYLKEDTRLWWGDKTKILTDLGVSGIWNDMNEPASFKGPLPDDVEFFDEDNYYYHDEIHNVYGHLMSKATYDGLKKNTGLRPFVITRACYAGSQKYSTMWTGDNHSMWGHVQMAIPQQCNMGLSGLPFIGTDIGGFGGDSTAELMARWIEVGCFSPLLRNHSSTGTKRQEPWCFNDEVTKIYRKHVNLRYELIPYYYDLFHEHESNGLPIIRPTLLEFQSDKKLTNQNDQFMVGEYLLVSPVVLPGQEQKLVYLPDSEYGWYDYFNGEKVSSGYSIRSAKLNEVPLFVRGGSIIPTAKVTRNLEEDPQELILKCFPGEGNYTHYVDDYKTFNYQKGEYNKYLFTLKDDILEVKTLHDGYDKTYNKLTVIYKNKTYEFDFNDGKYKLV